MALLSTVKDLAWQILIIEWLEMKCHLSCQFYLCKDHVGKALGLSQATVFKYNSSCKGSLRTFLISSATGKNMA